MTESDWDTCTDPGAMLSIVCRKLDHKRAVALVCKIVVDTPLGDGRVVWDVMPESSRQLMATTKRWLDGTATIGRVKKAQKAAAYKSADRSAAWAAYRAAAYAAYKSDDRSAAWAAYWAAECAADWVAYWAADWAADNSAARRWQCDTIRERVRWEEVSR